MTTAAGPCRETVDGMVLRQFCRPRCAMLLDTALTLGENPPLRDEIRHWNNGR